MAKRIKQKTNNKNTWEALQSRKTNVSKGNEIMAEPNINAIKFIQEVQVRLKSLGGRPFSLRSNSERLNFTGATISILETI